MDGDESYTQNKETSEKTRINHEQGPCVMCVWAPVKGEEVAKETDAKGNRFAKSPRRIRSIRVSHGVCKCRKST